MKFIILGAMSHVKVSFDIPEYVGNVDGLGTLSILEAVRFLGLEKKTRIYQASTSELYGGMPENKNEKGFMMKIHHFIQDLHMELQKYMVFGLQKTIREAYNMFACNGILFNHEVSKKRRNFCNK